jgi:hypothetical protein
MAGALVVARLLAGCMSQRSVSPLQPTEGCAKEKLGIPGGTPEKAVDKGEGEE